MLPADIIIKILKKIKNIPSGQIEDLQKQAETDNQPLEHIVLEKNLIKEEQLYAAASKELNVPLVNLKEKEISKDVIELIPTQFAEEHSAVAFAKTSDHIHLAMTDPTDIQTIEFVRRKTGLMPEVSITSVSSLQHALRAYHGELATKKVIEQLSKQEEPTDEKGDLKKVAHEISTINIMNTILEHAVYENASDIHIEPTERGVVVRYRTDGILRQVMTLPKQVQNGIVARVKVLAQLKIDEHMVPQDGRFKIDVHGESLSFRVSAMPVYGGEKIVMRLLHEGKKPLTLEELGLQIRPKELLRDAIKKPHGMVLVTGPTGSGKTTTLYSLLGILNTPEVNICTVEDPIEYHVAGVSQSQVNPRAGFNFANGLRSLLRQDPDIIMVGEIRDQETAEIAIHAAMTGHLVLSTLHTNDAPTTLPRLIDMGIPPFLAAFTLNCIVAQRLLRRVCGHCSKPLKLTNQEIKELSKLIDATKLSKLLGGNEDAPANKKGGLEEIEFYRGAGCGMCHDSGYKGRIGIYEILVMNEDLVKLINARANANEIREYALEKQNMITMLQDGLLKAKQGITTIEEVLRVTRE